jgi:hypothetical protein
MKMVHFKTLLLVLSLTAASCTVMAQGTVQLNNRIVGLVDAPISFGDGVGAGAYSATAELVLIGPGGSATVLLPTTTFRTTSPASAYYVNPVDVIVPGKGAGETATLILRAYVGNSYEVATLRGQTGPVTVTLGGIPAQGAPLPPAVLVGLQGFSIPEPSTIALGILGVSALCLRRRK